MIPQRTDASGLGGMNSSLLFRNGIKPGLVSPIFRESARPPGTVFGRYGPHKTNVEEPANRPNESGYRTGFEDDVTGVPWAAPEPEFNVGGGPFGAEGMAAMNHPASTRNSGDFRAPLEKALERPSYFNVPPYLKQHYADNPVATLFFGLAAIWIAWEILFNPPNEGRGVQGAVSAAGGAVATPGAAVTSGVTNTGKGAVEKTADATSDTLGGAVEAVEDAVDAVLPG